MTDASRLNTRCLMFAYAGVVIGVLLTLMRDGSSAGLLSAGFLVAGVVGCLSAARIAKSAYRITHVATGQDLAGASDAFFHAFDRRTSTS